MQPVPEIAADPLELELELHEARSRSRIVTVLRAMSRRRIAIASALYLAMLVLATLIVPHVTGYSSDQIDLMHPLAAPSGAHLLGTDENGRDMLTRLFVGAQGSLTIGVVSMLVAIGAGTVIGGLAGFFGNITDGSLMMVTDAFLAVPIFFIVMTVLMLFGPTLQNIVLVIGLTSWMVVARVVRSEVLKIKTYEFVTAASALGASRLRIFTRHILPQIFPAVIVAASLGIAWAILVETSLSYLGLGVQPPDPSWGNMLANAQQYMYTKPMLAVYPGIAIFLTVLAFNYLGSVLREVLDAEHAGAR